MKKLTYLLLSVMIILSAVSLCACSSKNKTDEPTSAEETTTPKKNDETQPTTDGKVTYTVTVVDNEGNPVSDAQVQCCYDGSCSPTKTNSDGVATFKLEENDYDVKFIKLPTGYEYSSEEEVFHFEDGKTELTITIKKVS